MNVYLTVATRYGLNILGLLGVSVALYLGASIFVPLIIAILLASILYPAAYWLHENIRLPYFLALKIMGDTQSAKVLYERARLPWFFACLTMIMCLVVIFTGITTAFAVSVPQIINKLPASSAAWEAKYKESQSSLANSLPFKIDGILPPNPDTSAFYQTLQKAFSPENVSGVLMKISLIGLDQISQLMLILFILLFLLLEGEMLARKVRAIFGPSTDSQQRVTAALGEMAEAVRTYLVWRTIVNLGLGIVLGAVYRYVFLLEQWYLWAVATMVLSYVPYIGTLAAGAFPVLEAAFNGQPAVALMIVAFYIGIVTFEGYIIVPWVMGRSMDLNATTVMISCLYWHLVWGLSGLFLAMPLMAAVKAVLIHVDGWKTWGELLSSDDVPLAVHHADIISEPPPDVDATVIMETDAPPKPA